MVSYNDITTLVSSGGTATFNGAGDTLWIDAGRASGLPMPAVRATVDRKPGAHGFIVHPAKLEGLRLVLPGLVVASSKASRDSLIDGLQAVLTAALEEDATLNEAGGSSLTVRCEIGLQTSGPYQKEFIFSLVSEAIAFA